MSLQINADIYVTYAYSLGILETTLQNPNVSLPAGLKARVRC